MTVALAEAVLEDEGAHADRVEPHGDLLALVVGGNHPVPAARADDDRRAGGPVGRGEVDGDLGLVHGLGADGPGRPAGPQQVELAVAVGGVHRGDGVGRGLFLGRGASAQKKRHRERQAGQPSMNAAGTGSGHVILRCSSGR